MEYINCGAYVNGVRPKTKKALKEAMQGSAHSVTFDVTDMFHSGTYRGDEVPVGVTLQVVGPDPYTKRNWYASVTTTTIK